MLVAVDDRLGRKRDLRCVFISAPNHAMSLHTIDTYDFIFINDNVPFTDASIEM
jgi:hypothetical protein